jgi:formylglycine-generating enzyme required for sulfatase activity
MVEIPGGSFLMGTNPDNAGKEKEEIARYTEKENAERWANTELPQHEVTVLPFHIGKFAVTQEQWSVVAGWEKVERDLNPDPARFKGDDRPVEQVSWHDAVEFCARLSKKLAACIGCQPKRNGNMPAEPEPPRHSLSAKPSRRRL